MSTRGRGENPAERGRRDRPSGSFLVRVWWEGAEAGGEQGEFRGYVRDLKTGAESYVADPGGLVSELVGPGGGEEPEPGEGGNQPAGPSRSR